MLVYTTPLLVIYPRNYLATTNFLEGTSGESGIAILRVGCTYNWKIVIRPRGAKGARRWV